MNAADFELHVSVPADPRFAETMRDLAAHAARYAGGTEREADEYGATVERIVLACVARATAGAAVLAIVRRGAGPVEFLIACEGAFDAATYGRHISVGWTHEQGTPMCRVALELG